MLGPLRQKAAAASENLDRSLLTHAPQVLRYLDDHGYRNVGTLKFRVKKGDRPTSDRVGPLNLNLATLLELAILLTMDLHHPLNVIHDASTVSAQLPGADHLGPDGRRRLFAGRYPLAWGNERVEVDAFLTGMVWLSPDLRSMEVVIMGFGRKSDGLEEAARFSTTTDPPALIDVGVSFQTRGFFDGGRVEIVRDEAITSASRIQQSRQRNPLQDPASPVRLEIYYDNRRVPLEERDGEVMIQEPREGQKVTLMLLRVDKTPVRYGAVLIVKGQNTLHKERTNPLNGRKWILGPEIHKAVIQGFLVADQVTEAFRILSRRESKARLMDYGSDVGAIHLVVHRERKPTADPKPQQKAPDGGQKPDEERDTAKGWPEPRAPSVVAEDKALMNLGAFPTGLPRPENPEALRFQLHSARKQSVSRGMMTEGGRRIKTSFHWETFIPEPTLVLSAKVVYYRPR